ncbi:MAG: hypothetical protein JWM14_2699 [Chitinophagaceae bacterium]|nr:hypothetical protein [Chitinophagaceae bacterium]
MKKILLFTSALAILLSSCSEKYETLEDLHQTPEQLKQQVQNGQAYLIDVRTPEEYKSSHLKNAVNVNFKSPDFKEQISKLDKTKPVYLYCQKGGRAKKATDSLKAYGFSDSHSVGGLEQLKKQGLTAE